jgi:hypothetical protein
MRLGDIFAAIGVLAFPLEAHADFQMDMTAAQVRSATHKPALMDLAVGEKGNVTYASYCHENGALYIEASGSLAQDRSEYGSIWIATRLSGGHVSIQVTNGSKATRTVYQSIVDALSSAAAVECKLEELPTGAALPVDDINGVTSLRSFLSQ